MFDCVLPTRLARHGKALTRHGDLNLKNAVHEADDRPIDEGCPCGTCATHSRAYLRHLVRVKELSAHRLLTIHNLRYTLDLIAGAGVAIEAGRFAQYLEQMVRSRSGGSS
jgi:queuine tRNA-ribosyltransferase